MKQTNVTFLHRELESASLPVVSVYSDGRVDYSRALTDDEKARAQQVIDAHDAAAVLTQENALRRLLTARAALVDTINAAKREPGDRADSGWSSSLADQIDALVDVVLALTDWVTARSEQPF